MIFLLAPDAVLPQFGAMPLIEIYTQPFCPYCARALALFDRKGVQYKEISAPRGTAEREESIKRSGRATVPQIFVDGASIGGCDDLMALERDGKLDAMLAG